MVVFKDRNVSLIFLMEVLLKNADFVLVTLIKLKMPKLTFEFSHACTENKISRCSAFFAAPCYIGIPSIMFSFTRHLAGFILAGKVFLRKHHEPRSNFFLGTVGG